MKISLFITLAIQWLEGWVLMTLHGKLGVIYEKFNVTLPPLTATLLQVTSTPILAALLILTTVLLGFGEASIPTNRGKFWLQMGSLLAWSLFTFMTILLLTLPLLQLQSTISH